MFTSSVKNELTEAANAVSVSDQTVGENGIIMNETGPDNVDNIKNIISQYAGPLSINVSTFFCILDHSGAVVYSSNNAGITEASEVIDSALAGNEAINSSYSGEYMDYALPLMSGGDVRYIIYVKDTLSLQKTVTNRMGINLAEATSMTLSQLSEWVEKVPSSLPEEMRPMAESIIESFRDNAKRLLDLGLGYLSLDRASNTLSTGERQRVQLARAVRNRTTGVLYVLDEPSIGLHPANIAGLKAVMKDLVADGNSVVLVDHDTEILKAADWLIELGSEAGKNGGYIIAEGTLDSIMKNPSSMIGPFLEKTPERIRKQIAEDEIFKYGSIKLSTDSIHTVRPLDVCFPRGRLSLVTGVSGSGKTTMILESLVPALEALVSGERLPAHVKSVEATGIKHVKLIDATPIGINIRSTVATYANVHDELRKLFAKLPSAKEKGYKAGDFSYNTGKLRCPVCDGTGSISLDVQFLPDVDIPCPECRGSRYSKDIDDIKYTNERGEEYSLGQLMDMDVNSALKAITGQKLILQRLKTLQDLGLGYLTLGEETPGLSGGEAQRLKLASEMGRSQCDSVFVFDEPTIGLHPLDVQTLLSVFQSLIDNGATVIVIEHDLDVIRNADYIVDMGPGGGTAGGTIVACGTIEKVRRCVHSVTGKYI